MNHSELLECSYYLLLYQVFQRAPLLVQSPSFLSLIHAYDMSKEKQVPQQNDAITAILKRVQFHCSDLQVVYSKLTDKISGHI